MAKKIILTSSDYKKLFKLIQIYRESNRLKSAHLRQLAEELENAAVTDDPGLLNDVVSINSTVIFKNIDTGKSEIVTVVFPADTDPDGSRISILSPLGTALIGEQESNITDCLAPTGKIQLRVEKIAARQTVISH
jgi:regulator of nucleoside diphosphate kinase